MGVFEFSPRPPKKSDVKILYKDHKGETATHHIAPTNRIWFGVSAFFGDGEQWFLDAINLDNQEIRSFAMKNILQWNPQ